MVLYLVAKTKSVAVKFITFERPVTLSTPEPFIPFKITTENTYFKKGLNLFQYSIVTGHI